MKAQLIIDSIGANPAYVPPRREDYATDEEFHDAAALYNVPPEVMVKAGTILEGSANIWMHCVPDASGVILVKQKDPHDGKHKPLPKRVGRGVVRAVPLDAGCMAAVAKHVIHAARSRRVTPEFIEREIAAGVAESLGEQAAIDALCEDQKSFTTSPQEK